MRLLAAGLLVAAIAGVVGGWDYFHVRGHPEEQATVTARVPTGHLRSCGRQAREEYALTWRSSDPPPGLPTTFAQTTACDVADLGSRHAVVRVVDGATVHVYVDPPTSVLGLLGWLVVGFVLGVLIGLAIWGFHIVRDRVARRLRRHRGLGSRP